MTRDALERRSKDELIALVLALATQVEALTKRVAELEAKLGPPPKTPDTSSLPPSQGEKTDRPAQPTKPRRGRPGTFRALAEHPDPLVEAFATACPYCCPPLAPADHSAVHASDHIDLPPIRPVVTRVHRHRGVCPCCGKSFAAPVPDGLEPGSPFGANLVARIVPLPVPQAISFERLGVLLSGCPAGRRVRGGDQRGRDRHPPGPYPGAAGSGGRGDRGASALKPGDRLARDRGAGRRRGSPAKRGGRGCCCPRPRSTTS